VITQGSNHKLLLDFLIQRWILISELAAIERVYIASYHFAQDNNQPLPSKPAVIETQPCRQIEIIKQHIIEILPEAHFIDYAYEAQAPLNPGDFMEMYIEDHKQCAKKVKTLMQQMEIT